MTKFTEEELKVLSQYVSDPTGDVFVVYPKLAGVVGAVYARYSRAKGGFREVLLKEFLQAGIIDQKHAKEFIDRVLNSYGDDSVGELEGAWLSLEGISNLATKAIEDCRIGGSPIEQSTRYVYYDALDENGHFRYLRVPEIMSGHLGQEFVRTMDFIFSTYCDLIKPMKNYFKSLKPLEEAQYDIRQDKHPVKLSDLSKEQEKKAFLETYNADIRTKACDVLRVMLPACTLTNVGIFGNGRFFTGLLTKLYSSDFDEFNSISEKAHRALNSVIPVYVARAKRSEYLAETERDMHLFTEKFFNVFPAEDSSPVELLADCDLETKMLAAMLYSYSEHPMSQLRSMVKSFSTETKLNLLNLYKGKRQNRRDRPGRALEVGYPIAFDCIADFGVYRDLQRERMKTQMRQLLTPRLGFVVPDEFIAIGAEDWLLDCYLAAETLYEKVRALHGRKLAQYCVLFGHNIRWFQEENYREALHEIELRTIPQGHPSYRKICQKMHKLLCNRDPLLSQLFQFVDHEDHYWSRGESEAKQRAKELKLK